MRAFRPICLPAQGATESMRSPEHTAARKPSVVATLIIAGLACSFRLENAEAGENREQADGPAVRVTVDPRVELMSIIFRLAGNPEYGRGRVRSYPGSS